MPRGSEPAGEYGKPWLRPVPVTDLRPVELEVFNRAVASMPDDYWRPHDVDLLEAYSRSVVLLRAAHAEGDAKVISSLTTATLNLARSLRLPPLSRTQAVSTGQRGAKAARVNHELAMAEAGTDVDEPRSALQ